MQPSDVQAAIGRNKAAQASAALQSAIERNIRDMLSSKDIQIATALARIDELSGILQSKDTEIASKNEEIAKLKGDAQRVLGNALAENWGKSNGKTLDSDAPTW